MKFLLDELARDQHALVRFQREAQAASALSHPNLCVIYQTGQDQGLSFMVMEYLDGLTPKHRIAGRPLASKPYCRWGLRLRMASTPAHCRGIIHCDIKPANIFLTKRRSLRRFLTNWDLQRRL